MTAVDDGAPRRDHRRPPHPARRPRRAHPARRRDGVGDARERAEHVAARRPGRGVRPVRGRARRARRAALRGAGALALPAAAPAPARCRPGSGIALGYLPYLAARGVECHYIESAARVERPVADRPHPALGAAACAPTRSTGTGATPTGTTAAAASTPTSRSPSTDRSASGCRSSSPSGTAAEFPFRRLHGRAGEAARSGRRSRDRGRADRSTCCGRPAAPRSTTCRSGPPRSCPRPTSPRRWPGGHRRQPRGHRLGAGQPRGGPVRRDGHQGRGVRRGGRRPPAGARRGAGRARTRPAPRPRRDHRRRTCWPRRSTADPAVPDVPPFALRRPTGTASDEQHAHRRRRRSAHRPPLARARRRPAGQPVHVAAVDRRGMRDVRLHARRADRPRCRRGARRRVSPGCTSTTRAGSGC